MYCIIYVSTAGWFECFATLAFSVPCVSTRINSWARVKLLQTVFAITENNQELPRAPFEVQNTSNQKILFNQAESKDVQTARELSVENFWGFFSHDQSIDFTRKCRYGIENTSDLLIWWLQVSLHLNLVVRFLHSKEFCSLSE